MVDVHMFYPEPANQSHSERVSRSERPQCRPDAAEMFILAIFWLAHVMRRISVTSAPISHW